MKRELHTVNGKFYGAFYELDDGRRLYLAHRTPGQIYRAKMAWCLDESTLRRCERLNIDAVGVVVRDGTKRLYYLTERMDFYDPVKSFMHFGDSVQRGLPAKHFRVNPATCTATILRRATIGR